MSDRTRLSVLIVSPDGNFRRLAATVLREAGHAVGTSDLRAERLAGRLRLHRPDVLLLEAEPPTSELIRDAVGGHPVIVWATDEPAPERAPAVGKWWPSADLVAGIEDAGRPRPRPHLRLVGP